MLNKLYSYVKNPKKILKYIEYKWLHTTYGKKMDDAEYVKKMFKLNMDYELDLDNPKTFNEKLQWLKLFNRKEKYTAMVDKYLSKDIVSQIIGDKYVAKVYGVWNSVDEIDWDVLPEQFVLKTTHDCGGVIVCRDKGSLNLKECKRVLKQHMKREYFYHCREWPYKNTVPKIMAEELLKDGENNILPVYKVFCFGGEPKIIQTIQNDKQINETIDYYDAEWNILKLKQNYPNSEKPLSKPKKLEEMLKLAQELSKDMAFIRVDFYTVNDEIFFSEFTFFSDAGFASFEPKEWDRKMGEWIVLPDKKA